jgi:hypothetical protein
MEARMLKFSVVCLAFLAFAAGCNLDTSTTGNLGKVSFSYSSSQCAIFGCGLDQPALQGSRVQISTTGGDPSIRPTAKLSFGRIGSVAAQSETCQCAVSGGSSRDVEPSASCATGETKSCSLLIDVDTTTAGDDVLEIREPSGALRDSVAIHVHPAAKIVLKVSTDANGAVAPVNGAYPVHVGENPQLHSTVYDSANQQLIFSEHGLSFAYADQSMLAPQSFVLGGATDIEYMTAKAAGDTSVVDTANGTSITAHFHIVQ